MSKQVTRRPTKQVRRQERREEQLRREAERLRAARNRKIIWSSIIAAIIIIVAASVFYYVYNRNQGQNQSQAETIVNPSYPPVDNIYCDELEQSAYHVHAHLTIYIDGKAVPVAQGVGIATTQQSVSCYYWLHTHDSTGVVHIESPAGRSFTLGNFFDIWGGQFQQLGYPSQLDLSSGWQTYVNGKPYNGDFHKIPLGAHTLITLAYNSPNVKPDTTYNWNGL